MSHVPTSVAPSIAFLAAPPRFQLRWHRPYQVARPPFDSASFLQPFCCPTSQSFCYTTSVSASTSTASQPRIPSRTTSVRVVLLNCVLVFASYNSPESFFLKQDYRTISRMTYRNREENWPVRYLFHACLTYLLRCFERASRREMSVLFVCFMTCLSSITLICHTRKKPLSLDDHAGYSF